jgi:hypothetical protein
MAAKGTRLMHRHAKPLAHQAPVEACVGEQQLAG